MLNYKNAQLFNYESRSNDQLYLLILPVCAHPDVVLIQDGVRVFADANFVKEIALAAHKHGVINHVITSQVCRMAQMHRIIDSISMYVDPKAKILLQLYLLTSAWQS